MSTSTNWTYIKTRLSKQNSPSLSESNFLATFEFEGSLGVSLEGDCHEFEVTPNLELLITFGKSLDGCCLEL
jgi:hypothetical protein